MKYELAMVRATAGFIVSHEGNQVTGTGGDNPGFISRKADEAPWEPYEPTEEEEAGDWSEA